MQLLLKIRKICILHKGTSHLHEERYYPLTNNVYKGY